MSAFPPLTKLDCSERALSAEDVGLKLQALNMITELRDSTTLADHAAQLLLVMEGARKAGFTIEEVINSAWLRLSRGKEQAS